MNAHERSHLAVLALAAALLAASSPRVARAEPPAAAAAAEGLALVPRDDATSLDRALELFDAALRADPKLYPARADRALAELLVAAARRDEGVRAGDRALLESGRALRERALDELRPLVRAHAQDLCVVRALAVYYGLEGDVAQVAKVAARAGPRGRDDWIEFAEIVARVRSGSRADAVPQLRAFAAAHPQLVRARVMLALAQVDDGRVADGLATLDDVLSVNSSHELALREKARLLAPPPPRAAVARPLHEPPPPQRPGYLPRKRGGAVEGPATRRAPAPLDAR